MARPQRGDRASVATETITLRVTKEERDWLERLIAIDSQELSAHGVRASQASVVRRLIRAEAIARRLQKGRTHKRRAHG